MGLTSVPNPTNPIVSPIVSPICGDIGDNMKEIAQTLKMEKTEKELISKRLTTHQIMISYKTEKEIAKTNLLEMISTNKAA